MAILTETELLQRAFLKKSSTARETGLITKDPEVEGPSVGETFGASFRQENLIGSFLTQEELIGTLGEGVPSDDPGFSGRDSLIEKSDGLFVVSEELLELADEAVNEEEVNRIAAFKAKQDQDRQIIAESGLLGFGTVAGVAAIDPLLIFSGALGLVAKSASIGASIAKGSAIVGTAAAAQEVGLQNLQTERTLTESALNTAFAAGIGGILGGAGAGLSKSATQAVIRNLTREAQGTVGKPRFRYDSETGQYKAVEVTEDTGHSVGAAETKQDFDLIKHEESIAGISDSVIKALAPFGFLRSPSVKGAISEFGTMRQASANFFGTGGLITNKNMAGIPSSFPIKPSIDREFEATMAGIIRDNKALRKALKESGEKIPRDVLERRIDAAIRNPQVETNTHIRNFANKISNQIDSLYNEIKRLNPALEKTDVRTAARYMTRRYDKDLIRLKRKEVTRRFSDLIRKYDKTGKIRGPNNPISKIDADDTADKIVSNILQENTVLTEGESSLQRMAKGEPFFTKNRTLMVPDSEVLDLLAIDVMGNTANYLRSAMTAKHVLKYLDDAGYKSLKEIGDELDREFNIRLDEAKTPKEQAVLNRNYKNAQKHLDDMINSLLGLSGRTDHPFDQALAVLRRFQFVTKLGGLLITSLVELATPIFKFGLPRAVRDGWFRGMQSLVDHVKARPGDVTTRNMLKDLGIGIEGDLNSLHRVMLDPTDARNFFDNNALKYSDKMVEVFGHLTGNTAWVAGNRMMAGHTASGRILDFIEQSINGKLSTLDTAKLRQLGIGKELEKAIMEQLKTGGKVDGRWFPNLTKWDPQVRARFGDAVFEEVNSTILIPRAGDIPFVIQKSGAAQTIFQFKSFSSAATSRIFLSGMQRLRYGDANALVGMTLLPMMGAMVYVIKSLLAGRDPDMDPDTLIVEGMLRSGQLGLFMETGLALSPLAPVESRYMGRNAESIIFGPSKSLIENAVLSAQGLTSGDMTNQQKKALASFLPTYSLFYMRSLYDKAFGIERER